MAFATARVQGPSPLTVVSGRIQSRPSALMAANRPRPVPTDVGQTAAADQPSARLLPGRIAFIRDGDVYTLDLATGAERRLTADGVSAEPRWSASGHWLAFFKGRDVYNQGTIWVAAAGGGQSRRIADAQRYGQFAWSPASDLLAYRTADGGLSIESADGSTKQLLAPAPGVDRYQGVQDLAWSPDGAWVAFDRFDPPRQPNLVPGMSIWRIRPDGSDQTEVFDTGNVLFWLRLDGWSPDGSQLLYFPHATSASLTSDTAGLSAVPSVGGTPRDLVAPSLPAKSWMLAYRDFVSVDPSGTGRIAVVEGPGREDYYGKTLHLLTPGEGGDAALTGPEAVVSSPAWSPDGRYLAYVSMPALGRAVVNDDVPPALLSRKLWLVDTTAQAASAPLTDEPNYRDEWPVWAPDGSALLFVRVDASSSMSLWAIAAAGGVPREIVDRLSFAGPGVPGYYGHVEWGSLFDWWPGTKRSQLGAALPALPHTGSGGLLPLADEMRP